MKIYKDYILNEGGELPPKYFLHKRNYVAYKRALLDEGILVMLDVFETEDEING